MEKLTPREQLQRIQRALLAHQAATLAMQSRLARQAKQASEQEPVFQIAVGPVTQLVLPPRAVLERTAPAPLAKQLIKDEENALASSLSDVFEPHALLETDDTLSFQRQGIGEDVIRRLRKGQWHIQAHLDLHGLRREEAREAVSQFVRRCHLSGLRCVRIVHGKGLGSVGKTPVLKNKVRSWLVQKKEVIAFVQAGPLYGGAGALLVLLDSHRPRQEQHGTRSLAATIA